MASELMQKVGELLELAGVDNEVIKSVTEKLTDENVVLEGEEEVQEEKLEEAACEVKHDVEGGDGTEVAPVDGSINKGGEKIEKDERSEEEGEAPVDKKINVGGVDVTESEIIQMATDLETLKEEYAKLVAEGCKCEGKCDHKEEKEDEEEEADESLEEALGTLLVMVKEAFEQTKEMKADFDILKEEYAKLVAERIIAEAEDDEVAMEAEEDEKEKEDSHKAEEENAKQHEEAVKAHVEDEEAKKDEEKGEKADAKEEEKKADKEGEDMRKNAKKEKEDYDKAHDKKVDESLDKTAEAIAQDVATITEEAVEVTPKAVKIAKAYSVFSKPLNESEEVKEEKKQRKAFTLFPNL